jgi:phage terminase small subunit
MAVKPKARAPKPDPATKPLTVRQQLFVVEYMVDLNALKAAIRAGYTASYARHHSAELLVTPHVAAAIAVEMEARSKRVKVDADWVLERWRQIASANPNELSQFRRQACRYCHGEGHDFQWIDEIELRAATADAIDRGKPAPARAGGIGYVAIADAHPECPRCNGEGVGRSHGLDTRHLIGSAAVLYAGVKETKDGLEIKMHDQMKALDNIARHLGMFNDKLQVTGKDGGPVKVQQVTVEEVLRALPKIDDEC